MTAAATWAGLEHPWRLAFEEAWASFRGDNFGIGAVLIDPHVAAPAEAVVSVGRNRVAQSQREPGLLSGNMTAHAEMNAFAALDRFNADGLHLYTTLEPCLMCAGTAMQLKVAAIHFAAADEFYEDMNDVWSSHPLTAERCPVSTGPLAGELAQFARLLPMIFTLRRFPGRSAEQLARENHPHLAAIADRMADDSNLEAFKRPDVVADALAVIWAELG